MTKCPQCLHAHNHASATRCRVCGFDLKAEREAWYADDRARTLMNWIETGDPRRGVTA